MILFTNEIQMGVLLFISILYVGLKLIMLLITIFKNAPE